MNAARASPVCEFLAAALERRARASFPPASLRWTEESTAEIARGVDAARFGELLSLASRHAPRVPFAPDADERSRAFELCTGWNPERWTMLEALRAALVLARADLEQQGVVAALEDGFAYADVGESCALYKTLQLLPRRERFTWRAGEGCRSSMRAVFEASACDTGYPFEHFDDLAWRQLVIKAVFVEAPLWRVFGLDSRGSEELARMALDLVDERRSAGRNVQHELWLAMGRFGGERARSAIEIELAGADALGRRAAAIALARAGGMERLAELVETERDPSVKATMEDALRGHITQQAFRALDSRETETAR